MQVKSEKGFTLLEILVSLLILSIAITGIMSVFIASRRYVIRSRHRLQATNIARQILEELYREVRQDTWGNTTTNRLWGAPPTNGTIPINDINYNWTITTSVVPGRDYRQVTVNVTYPALPE